MGIIKMKLIKILSFACSLAESKNWSSGGRSGGSSGGSSGGRGSTPDISQTNDRNPLFGAGIGMAIIGHLVTFNDVYEILSSFKPKTIMEKVSENDCRVIGAESGKTCYHITVKTSDKSYAGTDKKVELKLWNINPSDAVKEVMKEMENSDYVELDNWGNDLEKGATDEYYFVGFDMGNITGISIKHHGKGDKWKPEYITVNSKRFTFNDLEFDGENTGVFFPSDDEVRAFFDESDHFEESSSNNRS